MTLEQLQKVRLECKLTSDAAKAAIERIRTDQSVTRSGSKETAAVRRKSMDLSRALADLRRAGK